MVDMPVRLRRFVVDRAGEDLIGVTGAASPHAESDEPGVDLAESVLLPLIGHPLAEEGDVIHGGSQDYKDRLRANTEELVERGGFGSPTMFLDGGDMYFGNDRIPLVVAKVEGG